MGEEFTPRATWPSALWLTESGMTLGAISINFSNSPTCQHLTVSVPAHSTFPKEPLSCMGQQTLLHTPCCGCYHRCWDHFLSQVLAHAPDSTASLARVSGYGPHLSLQFSKPWQRQSPAHSCLRIFISYVCSVSCPMVPALFFSLLLFSSSQIPWLCPQILLFS